MTNSIIMTEEDVLITTHPTLVSFLYHNTNCLLLNRQ